MGTKQPRPWLTSTGVEIPTAQLTGISRSWDVDTWERYLKWYESGCREKLIQPDLYDDLSNEQTETVFQQFNQSTDQRKRSLCEQLLESLPAQEAKVLRLTFFEGKTVREIAAIEKAAKSTVSDLKIRALARLRWGHDGDNPDTRHLMRGDATEADSTNQSIWMQPLSSPIREERVYDPSKHKEELANITHSSLRAAVAELSEREQRILYLRFWCDFSISQIARELRSGVNLIEQLIEAAISKLKRKVIRRETGFMPGEGPSCA